MKEIVGGRLGDLLDGLATQIGEKSGRVGYKSGLAGPPAMWDRSKERRVGFDQQAIERDRPRGLLELTRILEGDDPGEGNVKPQIEDRVGKFPARGEAMDQGREWPFSHLLRENIQAVLFRV